MPADHERADDERGGPSRPGQGEGRAPRRRESARSLNPLRRPMGRGRPRSHRRTIGQRVVQIAIRADPKECRSCPSSSQEPGSGERLERSGGPAPPVLLTHTETGLVGFAPWTRSSVVSGGPGSTGEARRARPGTEGRRSALSVRGTDVRRRRPGGTGVGGPTRSSPRGGEAMRFLRGHSAIARRPLRALGSSGAEGSRRGSLENRVVRSSRARRTARETCAACQRAHADVDRGRAMDDGIASGRGLGLGGGCP